MSAHKRTYQILNARSLWNLLNYYHHYNDCASKPVWNWVIHVTVNSRRCSRCIIISIVRARYLPGYIPSRACFSSHHGKFEDGHRIIIKYRLRIVRRYNNNSNNITTRWENNARQQFTRKRLSICPRPRVHTCFDFRESPWSKTRTIQTSHIWR